MCVDVHWRPHRREKHERTPMPGLMVWFAAFRTDRDSEALIPRKGQNSSAQTELGLGEMGPGGLERSQFG